MEINGVAHLVLRVSRFEECVAFYDRLMPEIGLRAVHRREDFVYYVRACSGEGAVYDPAPEHPLEGRRRAR